MTHGSTKTRLPFSEMCLTGVNTQWVYSQGVIQKASDDRFDPGDLPHLRMRGAARRID